MQVDLEQENREISRRYRGLLRVSGAKSTQEKKKIRKAFEVALEAHKEDRRKSGEPYIYHPVAVARIVAQEMGMDVTSIVCALLHDTVEDTYITLDDIENLFGDKERNIIDGLTKIAGNFDATTSGQAENFRKILLTISDDIRVIMIKIADRLHNMRTLESMRRDKQLKIASETLFMYAPLAHRLGLYEIKTELEDLSLKYTEPEQYHSIEQKLADTKRGRTRFINKFIKPIDNKLATAGITFEVKGRTKSIYSIWNKMRKKNVDFEDIYDVFAVRIIVDPKTLDEEKQDIWRTYSIVTDFYSPKPDRLRDWVSMPKANGYESLHTTVMGQEGKWVEVQIRSRRMDEVAEKGLAAHWKYKDGSQSDRNLDTWLAQVREVLEAGDDNTLELIDNIKQTLHEEEIFVFTPKGETKILPKGATALDFAFRVHTQVGSTCTGVKVGGRLVPLSHVLKSGDQVEVLTSKNQTPKEDWLEFVVTGRARQKIKSSLNEEKRRIASDGKEMLQRKLRNMKADFISVNVAEVQEYFDQESATDMYYLIAIGKIDLKKLRNYEVNNGRLTLAKTKKVPEPAPSTKKKKVSQPPAKGDALLIGDKNQQMEYSLAKCCNPIAGDNVFGFVTVSEGIKIHRINCPNATELLGNYAYRVIPAKWAGLDSKKYGANLVFTGIDDVGLVNKITAIISGDLNVNMKSVSFESKDGIFKGKISVFVNDKEHLDSLIGHLRKVKGVLTVQREEIIETGS